MKKQLRYKFLQKGLKSQSQGLRWELNKWQKAKGELEMCNNGFHCSKQPYDAFTYVKGEIIAEVEVRGKHLADDNKECWEEMRIVRAWKWQKNDSVLFSIFAARLVLNIYEDKYPDDKRPRKAIEAADAYQKCPCEKHRSAAESAARSAAESAAESAARSAASAAWGAAWGTAWGAADAAWSAASAAIISKCNKWVKDHIKELERMQESLRA